MSEFNMRQNQFDASPDGDSNTIPQYLFLAEFFVHYVTGSRLAKLNRMFYIPTSVTFAFMDFKDDDVEITPVDLMFEPLTGIAENAENFSSGRSVLFAISTELLTDKFAELIFNITVLKKNPEKLDIIIGKGKLDFTKQFLAIRKEAIDFGHLGDVPSQLFEGDIPLVYNDEVVGEIHLYLRMSTFGQCVVTEFDDPLDTSSSTFIFKSPIENDLQTTLAYKCHVIDPLSVDICKDSVTDLYPDSPCQATNSPASSVKDVVVTPKPAGPIQSSRGPTQPCGKAVVLKVSGLLDQDSEKPTVTVAPESEALRFGPDGLRQPPDPDHDIFVLRIGKKGLVGPDEKCDIQLEMKTPKGLEKRPPLRYETREVQTEVEAESKKKKGSKEKKKK